jgi:integrase/recombinase XerC
MSLVDAVNAYVLGRVARRDLQPSSAHQVRWRLMTVVRALPDGFLLADLDRPAVLVWQQSIAQHRPATRRASLSTLRTFCRWATVEGLLGADPTAGLARVVQPRREPRGLSAAKVARLRLVLPDLRARVIVALMYGVGLRCCEVAGVDIDDYDPDPDGPTIRVIGKGGHERTLPVPLAVAGLLGEWLVRHPGSGPMIGLSAGRVSVLVSGWMAAAGLKHRAYDGISAHALRHTYASDALDRCGNVRIVQAALGHQSLATTQRYVRPATMEQMRRATDPDWPPAA